MEKAIEILKKMNADLYRRFECAKKSTEKNDLKCQMAIVTVAIMNIENASKTLPEPPKE